VFIFCAFIIASVVMANCSQDLAKENLTMTAVTFTVAILAAFRVTNAAMILAAIQTVIYIGLKIASMASGSLEDKISIGWIVVPGFLVIGYHFVNRAKKESDISREVMNDQINELIVIDPITGLYNLRSMYMDIQTQISYAERNNKQISLMIIKPKYVDEMKTVLKPKEFNEVIVRLSKVVCDTVRLEDRVYAIDSEGSFGVILTCDLDGARLVEDRLYNKFADKSLYAGIVTGNDIRVDMQLGCVQYDEKLNRDAIKFKELAQAAVKDISHDTSSVKQEAVEEIKEESSGTGWSSFMDMPKTKKAEPVEELKTEVIEEELVPKDDNEIEEIIEETVEEEEPGPNAPRRIVTKKVITRRVVRKEAQ
jgi:GGDEF domain-containing protein